MPLYEYYCSDCRGKFELLMSFAASEGDEIVCAKCHGPHVRKMVSVIARARMVGMDGDYFDAGSDFADDFGDSESAGGCCGGGACTCHD